MNIIEQFETEQIKSLVKGKKIPQFHPGDTIKVNVKIREGARERIQAFEGVCIAKKNRGLSSSFRVRKISFGEGVERVFPIFSPSIESVVLLRSGQVRRAKLYYLRNLTGKKARIVERMRSKQPDLASLFISESDEALEKEYLTEDPQVEGVTTEQSPENETTADADTVKAEAEASEVAPEQDTQEEITEEKIEDKKD